MKKLWLGVICFWVMAAQAESIKAIVNDTPISAWDVTSYARLLKAQQPETYEDMSDKQLNKIALDAVIENTLKTQKGNELNLTISEKEIDRAIQHLEQQNGLSVGGLQRLLEKENVNISTLRKQVRGDLIWLQYVKSKSDFVTEQVPDSAIQNRLKKIKEEMAKTSFSVAEIIVPSLEEAQSIWDELQRGSSSFADLAHQFSKAPSAKRGGQLGVIDENYYGSDIAPILKEMPVGQLSRPLTVKDGYALIVMLDKKMPVTTDSIMVWELAQGGQEEGGNFDTIMAAKDCDAFIKALEKEGVSSSIQRGWIDPRQLPDELNQLMQSATVKEAVGPVRIPDGQLFFMKCNVKFERVMPTKEDIRQQLEMEQMEMLSKRLLSAEKRSAVIEYKD